VWEFDEGVVGRRTADKGDGEVRLWRELAKKDRSGLEKTKIVKNARSRSDNGREWMG
jgi:hypothetical protein